MVGLVDIAPAAETVEIRGQKVDVSGVSAAGVAGLLARFPELRRVFAGRDVDADALLSAGGEIVSAIIAAGTGAAGDEATEAAAGRLGIDEQADLLAAILRVTLPKGVGPFMEKLTGLGGALGVDHPAAAAPPATGRATRSPKPSKR